MVLDIQWRSGFGYGDFVTGLGYAHNASIKYETDVDITFHWDHSHDYRHSSNDPETIIDRFWTVYNDIEKLENVRVFVKTDSKVNYRFINNLDEFNRVHGVWNSPSPVTDDGYILLWTSRYNTYFPGYDKDPICNQWGDLVHYLNNVGYRTIEVTYRTPVEEVLDLIRRCHIGVGYDGMIHQLFKLYRKPCLIFCKRKELNDLLLPFASQEISLNRFKRMTLEHYRQESKKRIRRVMKEYNEWLYDKCDPTSHELYNKPIGTVE
jgi:hypothetical protein